MQEQFISSKYAAFRFPIKSRSMAYEWILNLITDNNIDQKVFAEQILGRSAAVATNLFNGTRSMQIEEVDRIKRYFNVSTDFVLYGREGGEVVIPIGGDVAGGAWTEIIDSGAIHCLRYIPPRKAGKLLALKVKGQSMNRWAADGQYIIVDCNKKDPALLNGEPIIATSGDRGTFKIFKRNPDRLEPFSTEPDYTTLAMDHEWQIFGKVIDAVRNPEIIDCGHKEFESAVA